MVHPAERPPAPRLGVLGRGRRGACAAQATAIQLVGSLAPWPRAANDRPDSCVLGTVTQCPSMPLLTYSPGGRVSRESAGRIPSGSGATTASPCTGCSDPASWPKRLSDEDAEVSWIAPFSLPSRLGGLSAVGFVDGQGRPSYRAFGSSLFALLRDLCNPQW